jgi:plastocyanin
VTDGGRRRRLSAAGGALVLAFVLSLAVAPLPGSAGAATTECAWQRHSKRLVRHVKRHGKVKKLVRIKHYWTCNPVLAPETTVPPVLQPPATPPPTATPPSQPEVEANAVGVIADDRGGKKYTLTSPQGRAGEITIQLINEGEDPHNLNLQREQGGKPAGEVLTIGKTEPHEHSTGQFDLQAGTYRMYCSFGEHAKEGMETMFLVVE